MEVAELIFLILSKQHVKHLSKFAFRILQKTFQIWNDNHLIFYSSSRAIMCYLVNKYGQNNPTTQQLYPQVRYKHPNLNILEILECLDLEHCTTKKYLYLDIFRILNKEPKWIEFCILTLVPSTNVFWISL